MRAKRAVVLAGLVLGPHAAANPGVALEVGSPFPDLTLPAIEDGRPSSLADFRGNKLVLHVFASW